MMMLREKWIYPLLACLILPILVEGQRVRENRNEYYQSELGIGIGAANYYGDLNPHSGLEAVKSSVGAFYRYFFTPYFGASAHVQYAELGYADVYNSDAFRHRRNLSFNTSIWDFSLQGDFNFFRFVPGSKQYRVTPYLSAGIGYFHFNPYTYLQEEKFYLQPYGTEGQNSENYPDRKPYHLWSFEIPVEVGIKYSLNRRWNLTLSASYHFTGTDYLDDVSKTYVGTNEFNEHGTFGQQTAFKLQDRSGVYGPPIGVEGKQRGESKNNDQYLLVQLSISYLFTRYICPPYSR